MARILYSARALADLDRLFDFLQEADPDSAATSAAAIIGAVTILERHPHIGRAVRGPLRELVISFGRRGYVALYRVSSWRDRIEILAIRHQRQAGYHS